MSHLLQLLLLLALIILSAKLAGAAATRIGQPAVFGEILAGLVLGPTFLNVLGLPPFQPGDAAAAAVAHGTLFGTVRDLAEIGVILLMFVAGMETDLARMREVGSVAFWSALGGVLLPLVGGAVAAQYFGLPLLWEGVFIGTILTATSVSISAQTLLEIGELRSREGSTMARARPRDTA
jgi:Kef-type K+ transport system membrane component KefB